MSEKEKQKPARHPLENELQRICRAQEDQSKTLKMILIVLEKRLSGQVFSDFSAEAELKAREKQKTKTK